MLKQIVQVFGSNKVGGKMQGEAKNVHKWQVDWLIKLKSGRLRREL